MERLLQLRAVFHDPALDGRVVDHAFLHEFVIGQRRELCGLRAGQRLGHINRQTESDLPAARVARRLPGRLVGGHRRGEGGEGGADERHKQPEPHGVDGHQRVMRGGRLVQGQYCPAQILLVEHRRYGYTGRP